MFWLDFERFFMVRDGSKFFRVGVVRKGANKTRLNLNIDMLCMQELFFWRWVDYLKHCQIVSDVHIHTKGKKSINAEKDENVEVTHTQVFCGRLCVLRK